MIRETISHAALLSNASLDTVRYMDGRRECEKIRDSGEIGDLHILLASANEWPITPASSADV